jgi:solute carrier family 35 (UDP-sugar transporter), member A1/2/3
MDPKWVALIALVFQNSGLAVVMRYTFVATDAKRYLTSTAVVNAEIMKFVISVCASFVIDGKMDLETFKKEAHTVLVVNSNDWFKLMVPAVLYTLQNSLQYFSMSLLSAPVFQVMYQMKIITTAFFSVLILARQLSTLQWVSIVALAAGVAIVQLSQSSGNAEERSNSILGLISVLCACMTSGFAGVYFEMVLKSSKASIWLRNVQLSLIGLCVGLVSMQVCW